MLPCVFSLLLQLINHVDNFIFEKQHIMSHMHATETLDVLIPQHQQTVVDYINGTGQV